MNYRHVYMLIIEHAKSEEKLGLRKKGNGNYYERHHILPKSLFPLWTKKKSNLVLLTAREHFFCHQLLTKIYPCQETFCAVYMLASCNQSGKLKITSKLYEKLKEERSKFAGQWVKVALEGKTFEELYGKDKANIRKQQMSLSSKKFRSEMTEEQKEHMSMALSKSLKGRVSPTKGRKWYNNGTEQAMLIECPDGWKPGRLGGNTWSKGKHLSNAQKENLRKQRLGKKLSEDVKLKLKSLRFYNNGIITIRIPIGEEIPAGFVPGMVKN